MTDNDRSKESANQWGAPDNYGPLWRQSCWDASDRERGIDKKGGRAVTRRLDQVQPESVSWLFPGRIPVGKLTLLEGDPGLGKSTLIADLTARVTRGEGLPGDPSYEPADVILLTAEDGVADTVLPRSDAAGADTTRVHIFDGYEDAAGNFIEFTFGDPRDQTALRWLEAEIHKWCAKLVCIDVLVAFLDSGRDTHRDHDVRRALRPLAKLAETTGCAIIGVRHLRKSAGGNAIAAGGGSIGIAGAARSVLLVDRDPSDPDMRVLAVVKSNLSQIVTSLGFSIEPVPTGSVCIVWHGQTRQTADSLTAARAEVGAGGGQRSKLRECVECVTGWLESGPVERRELLDLGRKQGFSASTVERAATELRLVSTTQGFGREKHSLWRLPVFPSTDPISVNAETLRELDQLDGNEARPLDEERAIEREAIEHENDPERPNGE